MINKILVSLLIIIICILKILEGIISIDESIKEGNVVPQKLYERLMNDFHKIFPDRNRNSGGAQFFHHIMSYNPTKDEFDYYNRFYCAVSGSPIDVNRKDNKSFIYIEDLDGNKICGDYYRCCVPCNCDLMKYSKVEKMNIKLSDGNYDYYVITIDDPCKNESSIPESVTSFKCSNGKTQNGIHAPSGRLIKGILHNGRVCDENDINDIESDPITGEYCRERNSTHPDDLQGGMGDIFVKLSLVSKGFIDKLIDMEEKFIHYIDEFLHPHLKNIYGEPLKPCKKFSDDKKGSWDNQGHCSERGGGVHQICFDVSKETSNFSNDTGQSDWSKNRVGKNHCMCLGAWALYKAKQNKNIIDDTDNELNCEAIPEMSLSSGYVDNWNTWNGNELDDQIVDGVNSLMEQCYRKGNESQKKYLKNIYNNLTKSRSEFHNTETYNKYQL